MGIPQIRVAPSTDRKLGRSAALETASRIDPQAPAGWAEIVGADDSRAFLLSDEALNARAALDGPALGWTAPVAERHAPKRRFELAPRDADRVMLVAIAAAVTLLAWVVAL